MNPCKDCNYRLKLGYDCYYIGHLNIVLRALLFLFGCSKYSPWWVHTTRRKP